MRLRRIGDWGKRIGLEWDDELIGMSWTMDLFGLSLKYLDF